MKKTIITLALALISLTSLGSDGDTLTKNFKKVIKNKPSGKDTFLVVSYTITTVDTIKRSDYNQEIERFERAYKSSEESIAIQSKLSKYYLSEIKRLKAEKKKTD